MTPIKRVKADGDPGRIIPDMHDADDAQAVSLYRTMSHRWLHDYRAALALDARAAVLEHTRRFCEHRIALIDRVLAEPEAKEPPR